ncbi:MAG: hypothetical protein EAZ09_19680 [Oscillatoriales cyanobacterium]|nr:MAG: hypothetical protein EAZ18_26100 [Oscillatoriales cyanobacterium]TAH17573.1 MAG: hypothetical protein EAZ09_19680 [Oscillatoriales cyanobacterium]
MKIPKLSQKPGFLESVGSQKPGFFLNFGGDAKIIAETRFLGFGEKPKQKAPLFLGALFDYLRLKINR